MSRRRTHNDQGSALVIALVFVTAISLMVGAVLSFADVGLRASKTYKERSEAAYAADGAITAATKRYSTTGPCDNFTAPLVGTAPAPGSPVNGQGVTVRCEGPPAAGSKATQPNNFLLSLGDGPNGGISSTEEMRLVGDIFSKTTVKATATMVVQGEVAALRQCTGPIQTSPPTPLHCATGSPPVSTADPSQGRDPDFTPAATAVPQRRTAPAPAPGCGGGWLIPLEPGYYDDPLALSALTGTGSCNDKVVWFQPGTYYFDLTFRGGTEPWKVDNPRVDVVAGTPRGWDPAATERPELQFPGSCLTKDDPLPNNRGVQFIAGGGTRLEVIKGRMELCATPSTTEQQIALFGLQEAKSLHTLEATSITTTQFTNVLNAQTVGEAPPCPPDTAPPCPLVATATLTGDTPTATLALDTFRPGVPSDSVIQGVSLLVKHRQDGDLVDLTATVDFAGSTCGTVTPAPLGDSPGAMGESRIDLGTACGLTSPDAFAGLKVTYAATLRPPATGSAEVAVDGVVVEATYRTPTTRRPTTVLPNPGFTPAGNALEIGEQPDRLLAEAVLGPASTPTATIALTGMGDPLLPEGTTIESARLRVSHRDIGDLGDPRVTVPLPSGTCTNLAVPRSPDAFSDYRLDLDACGLNTPDELKDLTVFYTAALSPGGSGARAQLDGVWLELVTNSPEGPGPAAPRRAATAASTASPGTAAFTNADLAKRIAEQPTALTSDAALSGQATNATATLGNFNTVPLPPGSVIRSASLQVAHQEDQNVAGVGLAVAFPDRPGCPAAALPPATGALASTSVPLIGPCALTSPEQLAGLTAVYSALRTAITTAAAQIPARTVNESNFAPPDKGRLIDGATTDARLKDKAATASVTLAGFDQTPPPPGSAIDTAMLRIVHRDEGDLAFGDVTVIVTFPGSTCTAPQPLVLRRDALQDDFIDLRACGLTDPSQLAALQVVYRVSLNSDGKKVDDFLDGMELALAFRPPAVAKLDGIELNVEFEAPRFRPLCPPATLPNCDLVKVAPATTPAPDTSTRFVASGTVYAPSAGVDMKMYGLDTQVLTRGLIARAIKLGLQSPRRAPVGAIPPEAVRFTAYPDVTVTPSEVNQIGPEPGFRDLDNAKALREQDPPCPPSPPCSPPTADADLGGSNPTTASLELKGFAQPGLPGDVRFDGAVLRVRHQDLGNVVEVTVRMGATTCATQVLASRPAALRRDGTDGEDQIFLPAACGLDRPSKIGDLSVLYKVELDPELPPTPPPTATARLDGITLEVLSGPLVRASLTFDRAKATVVGYSVQR